MASVALVLLGAPMATTVSTLLSTAAVVPGSTYEFDAQALAA
jgi:hypothetical protein